MIKRNIAMLLLLAILIFTPVSSTSCKTEDALLIVGGAVIVTAAIIYIFIPQPVFKPDDNINQSVSCGDLTEINIINETGSTWEFCLAGEHIGSIQPDSTAVFSLTEGVKDAVFSCDDSKYPVIFEENLIIDDQYAIVIRELSEIEEIR